MTTMKMSSFNNSPEAVKNTKFRFRMAESEKTGFAGKVNQFGINMVDLMMWLVIAALLLAAALQGIGFYQKAAWNYQLDSDAAAVRTYMEAQYTLNSNTYPTVTITGAVGGATPTPAVDTTTGALKLTTSNGVGNEVHAVPNAVGGWTANVCSMALKKAGVALPAINIQSADTSVQTAVICS